jgi:glycosyltransferase involved in cell wall biosynthesis
MFKALRWAKFCYYFHKLNYAKALACILNDAQALNYALPLSSVESDTPCADGAQINKGVEKGAKNTLAAMLVPTIDALSAKKAWAFYQLDMYESVVGIQYQGQDWRGLYASIVSFSACGLHALANTYLLAFASHKKYSQKCVRLAESIGAYNPSLALKALLLTERKPDLNALNIHQALHIAPSEIDGDLDNHLDYLHFLNCDSQHDIAPHHPLLYVALQLKLDANANVAAYLNHFLQTLHQTLSKSPKIAAKLAQANAQAYLLLNHLQPISPLAQLDNINQFLQAYGLSQLTLKNKHLPPSATNIICRSAQRHEYGPLVSIIMTTYNAADFVLPAIDSLLAQSYTNIEIIIVDDASTDNTFAKLKQVSQQHSQVKVLALPHNAGTYVAKTIALSLAKGEFITCQDSDDWSHPNRIHLQLLPLLKDKALIATTSNWVRIAQNGTCYTRGAFPLARLNPASPLFRKDQVLTTTGTWDLVKTGADSEFLKRLKLVFGRKSVMRVALPLCFGAHRVGSLMTAADTGHHADCLNDDRQRYWQQWNLWHIATLTKGKKPIMPNINNFKRAFIVPKALEVSLDDIKKCLQGII